jgi:glycosyltransferase involved in cell wall biosynthesis
VIRAFALYQRRHAPDARLLLAGVPLTPAYFARLERLVRDVRAENVELAPGIPDARLKEAYAEANAFLLLSEHEGFCVPLLEAIVAGVPVVARPAGGMPEVGADAVLWADDGDPALAAELLHLAVSDAELRATLFERGRARAEAFAHERVAERVRAAIEAAR